MNLCLKILGILVMMSFLCSCHVARYFYWNLADVRDYKKFPSLPVSTGTSKTIFNTTHTRQVFKLPNTYKTDRINTFERFLEKKKTNAFIILKNDTIIYKKYFNGYNDSSVCPSFSVSKVFVSALTGIAIHEGKIADVDDSFAKYFTDFSGKDISRVTVENLLNMRSGIRFSEAYSTPFSSMAKYYYGKNLLKYIHDIELACEPDSVYEYISMNALLLGKVVEHATGMKLNRYLEEKIWKPAGMNYNSSWSIDSRKNQTIKSFCCLNACPVDYAIFGNLYLKNGFMNGQQIIPVDWVKSSTKKMNNSIDSQGYSYTYLWRVLPDGSYFAKGVLGQYIYVILAKT